MQEEQRRNERTMQLSHAELGLLVGALLEKMIRESPPFPDNASLLDHPSYPLYTRLFPLMYEEGAVSNFSLELSVRIADRLVLLINSFDLDEEIPGELFRLVNEWVNFLGFLLCWRDTKTKYMLSIPDPALWKGPLPGKEETV